MTNHTWERGPFQSMAGSLRYEKTETSLPFSVGAVSRQGSGHSQLGIANQDALDLQIENNLIAGALCDGCTTNEQSCVNDYSHNQVGAAFLSQLICNLCYDYYRDRKKRTNTDKFLKWIANEILQRVDRIIKAIKVPHGNRASFIQNFLTCTIIGFVIRENEFFIFHCGDGVVKVNQTEFDLSHSQGRYYVKNLIKENSGDRIFNLVHQGNLSELNQLLIASDGLAERGFPQHKAFRRIYFEKQLIGHTGYIDLIPEFHTRVLNEFYSSLPPKVIWPRDDSSLILVRRIKQE